MTTFEPLLDHPAYHLQVKLPGYFPRRSVLQAATDRDKARALKKANPEWTKEDHQRLALMHALASEHQFEVWNQRLNAAAMETFGRPFGFFDYRVSGIGREEFSAARKEKLRFSALAHSSHLSVARGHAAAIGIRNTDTFLRRLVDQHRAAAAETKAVRNFPGGMQMEAEHSGAACDGLRTFADVEARFGAVRTRKDLEVLIEEAEMSFHADPQKLFMTDENWVQLTGLVASKVRELDQATGDEGRQYRNFYVCPDCGTSWEDIWDAQCDDECPHCQLKNISPYKSEDA